MNKAKLKSYAPQARKDFIAAVVAHANLLGIFEKNGKLEFATSEQRCHPHRRTSLDGQVGIPGANA